ncbi:MAG TPA: hypothetical protein VMT46_14400 [Anaerolineaceae bacterium]|nr:hypothetical protein [Anaerolineaceae bacterium]
MGQQARLALLDRSKSSSGMWVDALIQENDTSAEALCDFSRAAYEIDGDRQALENLLRAPISDEIIARLFGAIQGSRVRIEKSEKSVDVWTSNHWYHGPLYFSLERDPKGVNLIINDFFLKEEAPPTLGTRIVAALIFQARQISEFDSILATATRRYFPKEGDELVKEVMGYYFFPRLGFNADPKNADEFIDIPEKIRGKKLLAIIGDPDLRAWWKGNGQTIEVRFRVKSKRSLKALNAYLAEMNIRPQM